MESSSVNRHFFVIRKNFVEWYVYERVWAAIKNNEKKNVIRTSITKKKQRKMRKNMAIIETWSYTLTSVVDGEKKQTFSVRIWKYDRRKLQHFGTCDSRTHTHFFAPSSSSLLFQYSIIHFAERGKHVPTHSHTGNMKWEKYCEATNCVCACACVLGGLK